MRVFFQLLGPVTPVLDAYEPPPPPPPPLLPPVPYGQQGPTTVVTLCTSNFHKVTALCNLSITFDRA